MVAELRLTDPLPELAVGGVKGVTLVYLNTVIRWTRLTRQTSKWVDSLYL